MITRALPLSLAVWSLAVAPVFADTFNDIDLDVPYVPTPQDTVEAMLDMVDLKDGDVVWDLGCGDGRMVISAAKRKNIKGFGVDIDPERIKESKENAETAGVADKVEFRVANLFNTDFSNANVLMMYLLERVNRDLRPVILRDLAPGSRIVSNTFSMGEWAPDKKNNSDEPGFYRTIYFWVVPANVSGEWDLEMDGQKGLLSVTQSFQKISGKLAMGGSESRFEDGEVNGTSVKFQLDRQAADDVFHLAEASGDTMTGTVDGKPWKATRKPGTKVELDPVPDEEDP